MLSSNMDGRNYDGEPSETNSTPHHDTAAFKAGKIPSNPFGAGKGGAAIPPPSILQTRPGGMPTGPPTGPPPGQPPPLLGPPGRPPMMPPMMMPPGGPPGPGGPGMPMPPGMPPGMLANLNRMRPPMGMPPLMPPPGMGGLIPRPLIPQPNTNSAPPTSQSM